jgi:hypothetical protein
VALYRAFFSHIQVLERAASELDAQGKNGQEIRSYYQTTIGLSASDAAILKQNAAQLVAAVIQKDQQAKQIIDAVRAKTPNGRLTAKDQIPKPPPELGQLNQERDDVTNAQIQALHSALGDASFGRVDNYVRAKFAKNVTPLRTPSPIPNGPGPMKGMGPTGVKP